MLHFWRSINLPALIVPLMSAMFFGFGLLFLYLMGQVSTLDCSRVGNGGVNCSLLTTWMDLSPLDEKPISQIELAYVQQQCDEDGCTYRVTLHSRFGDFPLTSLYSSGKAEKEQMAHQINTFVQDTSQPTLRLKHRELWGLLLPLVFLLVGILLAVAQLFGLKAG